MFLVRGRCSGFLSYSSPPANVLIHGPLHRGISSLWENNSDNLTQNPLKTQENTIETLQIADNLLALGYSRTVELWNIDSREQIQFMEGYRREVASFAFSNDRSLLASANGSNEVSLIYVRKVDPRASFKRLIGHTSWVNGISFCKDGSIVSTGGDRTIRFWDSKRTNGTLHFVFSCHSTQTNPLSTERLQTF